MNDLVPPTAPTALTVRERVRRALAPVASTVVPGALVGAIYLTTGSHWQAAKATLERWGIAPELSVFAAPAVGICAVLGLRYLWRQMRVESDDDAR